MKSEMTKKKDAKRLSARSLKSLLIYKFLHEYGYEKGRIVVEAIVNDIINLIEKFYLTPGKITFGQMLWLSADKDEVHRQGKTIRDTKMVPIKLTIVDESDLSCWENGYDLMEIKKRKIVRWIKEAYKQGAALTQLEASFILGLSSRTLCRYLKEYISLTGEILPTRGNVQDIGPGVTHKRKIIEYYLQGMFTPEIAKRTYHSKEAVDRYINSFEKVKALALRFEKEELPALTRMSESLIEEYLELCQIQPS